MTKKPQVEITGWEARNYDRFLDLIFLGRYEKFVSRVIDDLQLRPEELVADLGAGTGRMASLILKQMNKQGRIYALEIGEEMKEQLYRLQKRDDRLMIIHQRIDEPFLLPIKVTLVFISFVLHGLKQAERLQVIQNVYQNLQVGGKFCILDYNHFSLLNAPWYIRLVIRHLECKPTEDFIARDWPALLQEKRFSNIQFNLYFSKYIRLLCCQKI
jgi:ubiquinone/menaquinone biosynthesis C-methylase UbiE